MTVPAKITEDDLDQILQDLEPTYIPDAFVHRVMLKFEASEDPCYIATEAFDIMLTVAGDADEDVLDYFGLEYAKLQLDFNKIKRAVRFYSDQVLSSFDQGEK